MSRWFRIHDDMINDRTAHEMEPEAFKVAFVQAAKHGTGPLSHVVKPDHGRLNAGEWSVIRRRIFKRDDYTCRYCDARGVCLHCDHVLPVAHGGTHEDDNLVAACEPCNRAKWAHVVSIEEFRAVRRAQ